MANRNIELLDPNFLKKVRKLLEYHPNIFVTDGKRTTEEQQALYALGRTKKGKIVTNCDGIKTRSNHQDGIAIDIAFSGENLYPKERAKWEEVAKTARSLGINWGGDWKKFPDLPHFEDDGTVFKEKNEISPWAKESVEKAKKNGIANDWHDPQEIIGNAVLEAILSKLGVIQTITGKGVTKEQFIVVLDRLKAFD